MSKFSLVSKPLGSLERLSLVREDNAFLDILIGFGAGLNAWHVPAASKNYDLLEGYPDEETFQKTWNDTSAGVRLAPWPGRVNNANWSWNGNTYRLENNVSWASHALHGLVHTKKWNFVSFYADDSEAVLKTRYDWTGNHAGFPFPFRAETTFRFRGESFTVESFVCNTGSRDMPYAEGFHPYFKLGEKINGLKLKLPKVEKAIVDSADIPTGEREVFSNFEQERFIGDLFLNDCFLLRGESARAEVVLSYSDAQLEIFQESGKGKYEAIQVYTPPSRESIAIEPMTNEPDVLNHHRDLIVLKSGESLTLRWGASFQFLS